jgi:hypothetical protein
MISTGGRPIWNDMLMIAQKQILAASEKQTQKDLLQQLKCMLCLKESSIWQLNGNFKMS